MAERIGTPQAAVFRGKTVEEIVKLFNEFNKSNKNIEYISFAIDAEITREVTKKDFSGDTTKTMTMDGYFGTYYYTEYDDHEFGDNRGFG